MKGRDIILEDLREMCLYKQAYAKESTRYQWWGYMKYVHTNCYNYINEDCSKEAHKKMGLNWDKTIQCVNESFSNANWGDEKTKNDMIDNEIKYWKKYGSGIYPSIVVNNRTYRGQLESLAVFNAICSGFENAPDMCLSTLGAYKPDFLTQAKNGIKGSVIVAIVLAMIFLNIIVIYCYRRYSRREMQNEM